MPSPKSAAAAAGATAGGFSPTLALLEHSFFFTTQERERIATLRVRTHPSLMTRAFRPLLQLTSRLIPNTVAPNAIALLSAVLSMQALQVLSQYYSRQRDTAVIVASLLLLGSSWSAAVDGVHADRCRSGSFLGVLFSEICHTVKHMFFTLSVLLILGISDLQVIWYVVMAMLHIRLAHTFVKYGPKVKPKAVVYSRLFSSSELVLLQVAVLAFPQYVPLESIASLIVEYAFAGYVASVGACLVLAPLMRAEGTSLVPLGLVLLSRLMPSIVLPLNELQQLTVIADAMVLGTISLEVVVSTFSNRTIHSIVSVIAVLGGFNGVLAIAACSLYVVGMLTDLSVATRTPLFVPLRNVYIDGVFDLCHIGHKRLMEFALKHGNRLVVGVLSDEDTSGYKRKPIMTLDERCTEVRSCRWVSEVIPAAPAKGLTEEFLEENNIHVVVYGEEYDTPTDHYYAAARKLGIGVTAPRTPGMSTSEIIRRISSARGDELEAKDKLNPNKKAVST